MAAIPQTDRDRRGPAHMNAFEPKLCEHGIAAGTCHECAMDEYRPRVKFKFDAASLHPIRPNEFREIVVTDPNTSEQRSLFVPDQGKDDG